MSEERDSRINIEDFARVQMRVGQIREAEKIEGSRKLIRLMVDIGTEMRQVVAGIADVYDPESLLNRKVILVATLKPVRLMGVESDGMIVAASVHGKPVLATFNEEVPNAELAIRGEGAMSRAATTAGTQPIVVLPRPLGDSFNIEIGSLVKMAFSGCLPVVRFCMCFKRRQLCLDVCCREYRFDSTRDL